MTTSTPPPIPVQPAGSIPGGTFELSTDPAEIAVAFTRVLRGAGLRVPTSSTHTFAEALCAVGLNDRDCAYWSARMALSKTCW